MFPIPVKAKHLEPGDLFMGELDGAQAILLAVDAGDAPGAVVLKSSAHGGPVLVDMETLGPALAQVKGRLVAARPKGASPFELEGSPEVVAGALVFQDKHPAIAVGDATQGVRLFDLDGDEVELEGPRLAYRRWRLLLEVGAESHEVASFS